MKGKSVQPLKPSNVKPKGEKLLAVKEYPHKENLKSRQKCNLI